MDTLNTTLHTTIAVGERTSLFHHRPALKVMFEENIFNEEYSDASYRLYSDGSEVINFWESCDNTAGDGTDLTFVEFYELFPANSFYPRWVEEARAKARALYPEQLAARGGESEVVSEQSGKAA